MALMGVAFAMVPAVLWMSIVFVVDRSRLGLASAVVDVVQQVGLVVVNLLVGWSNDRWLAGPAEPGGLSPGDVDLHGARAARRLRRDRAAAGRDGAPRPRPRDDQDPPWPMTATERARVQDVMELYQLEHFIAVVEEHSFTRAAERVVADAGRGERHDPEARGGARRALDGPGPARVHAHRGRPGAARVRADASSGCATTCSRAWRTSATWSPAASRSPRTSRPFSTCCRRRSRPSTSSTRTSRSRRGCATATRSPTWWPSATPTSASASGRRTFTACAPSWSTTTGPCSWPRPATASPACARSRWPTCAASASSSIRAAPRCSTSSSACSPSTRVPFNVAAELANFETIKQFVAHRQRRRDRARQRGPARPRGRPPGRHPSGAPRYRRGPIEVVYAEAAPLLPAAARLLGWLLRAWQLGSRRPHERPSSDD